MTSRLKNHPSKHKKRVAIKNVIHLSQVLLTTKLSNVMQQIIGMACPIGVGANDEPNVIICWNNGVSINSKAREIALYCGKK